MSTEKMREEFEAWIESEDMDAKCESGFLMWEAWNASRAAIEVELPQGFTHHGASDQTEYVLEAGSVVTAIESLGLKVKP